MKIKNTKIMKKALPIVAFLMSISAVAKTAHPQILQQDPEGPEAPPGVAIDSYIILLLIISIVLAGMYFFKMKKQASTTL